MTRGGSFIRLIQKNFRFWTVRIVFGFGREEFADYAKKLLRKYRKRRLLFGYFDAEEACAVSQDGFRKSLLCSAVFK